MCRILRLVSEKLEWTASSKEELSASENSSEILGSMSLLILPQPCEEISQSFGHEKVEK
jgi:hypothetical protein